MQLPAGPDSREWNDLVGRIRARPLPVEREPGEGDAQARRWAKSPPEALFPGVRSAGGALAGLLLMSGCWTEAHDVANEIHTREGSYWHALIHRMEPETWNSDYWFGRVGEHPLFADLLGRARSIAAGAGGTRLRLEERWKPEAFNALCDEARNSDDEAFVRAVAEIHSLEAHLLWEWCAATASRHS